MDPEKAPRRPPNRKEILCPPAYFAHERKWIDFVMAAAYVWLLCLAATPIPRLLRITIQMLLLSPMILMLMLLALLRY